METHTYAVRLGRPPRSRDVVCRSEGHARNRIGRLLRSAHDQARFALLVDGKEVQVVWGHKRARRNVFGPFPHPGAP